MMEKCRFCKFLYVIIAVYFESTVGYMTIRRDRYVSKDLELQHSRVSSCFVCIGLMGVLVPSLVQVHGGG